MFKPCSTNLKPLQGSPEFPSTARCTYCKQNWSWSVNLNPYRSHWMVVYLISPSRPLQTHQHLMQWEPQGSGCNVQSLQIDELRGTHMSDTIGQTTLARQGYWLDYFWSGESLIFSQRPAGILLLWQDSSFHQVVQCTLCKGVADSAG